MCGTRLCVCKFLVIFSSQTVCCYYAFQCYTADFKQQQQQQQPLIPNNNSNTKLWKGKKVDKSSEIPVLRCAGEHCPTSQYSDMQRSI